MMSNRLIFLVGIFAGLVGSSGVSAEVRRSPTDIFFWNYVENLPVKSAFYASCLMGPETKAVVVIPVGLLIGRFFIIEKDRIIASIGDVTFEKGRWQVTGVSGDQTESLTAAKLGDGVFTKEFKLVGKNGFHSILDNTPNASCDGS